MRFLGQESEIYFSNEIQNFTILVNDLVHSFSKQILKLLVILEYFKNVDHVIVAPNSGYETDLEVKFISIPNQKITK